MTFSSTRGDRRTQDDLVFKTIDGNDISLDVIIAYRIDATKRLTFSSMWLVTMPPSGIKSFEPSPGANRGIFSESSRPRPSTWPKPVKHSPKGPGIAPKHPGTHGYRCGKSADQ